MRKAAIHVSATALLLSAPMAQAASHARMIESYADPAFDRAQAVWVAPVSERQAADPVYKMLKVKLEETLRASGFEVGADRMTKSAVTMEYHAGPSGLPVGSGPSLNDPSYRTILITGYDVTDVAKPKLMWQTMMEEWGVSADARATIPGLIRAAKPYFGVAKTPLSAGRASWCAERPALAGSHIAVTCSKVAERPLLNMTGYNTSFEVSRPLPGVTPSGPR